MLTLNYYLTHINNLIEVEPEIVSTIFKNFKFGQYCIVKTNETVVSDTLKFIEFNADDTHLIGFKFAIQEHLNIKSFKLVSYIKFGEESCDKKIIYSSDKKDIVGNIYDIDMEAKMLKHLEKCFDMFIKEIEFSINKNKEILKDIF